MVKSRRVRWVGHVAHTGEKRNECICVTGVKARRKETTRKT
jgi:hypothetical protein